MDKMPLSDGHIFPIPVTLPVGADADIQLGRDMALRDAKNNLLAVMIIEEIYEWGYTEVSQKIFGTQDLRHSLVAEVSGWGRRNILGRIRVLQLPSYYDFQDLRLTPAQTRSRLEALGKRNVVAFQTRNPMHRVHEEMTRREVAEVDGVLLLHPSVGMTKPGDVDHYTRVRTYNTLVKRYYRKGGDGHLRRRQPVSCDLQRNSQRCRA
jgi:sulfate adenylyltransferase